MTSDADASYALARFRLAALFALVCAVASVRGHARAEDEDASPQYKALIEQALDEFKHKNWPEARVLFRRAHELSPNARTLRGMGIVSYEMRDYVQAVRDLRAALLDARQPLNDAQKSECEGLLERARTFVGVFTVRVEPAEADLTLDASRLVREPDGTVLLAFGEHTLRGSAPGHQDGSVRISVQGGEKGEVALTLLSSSAAVALARPHAPDEAAPKSTAQGEARSSADERPGFVGGGLRYTWVALSVSAALGASAVTFWFLGDKKLDELDARCARAAERGDPCVKGKTDTDSVERYERLTNGMIGGAAGALAVAAVLAVFEWPRERKLAVSAGVDSLRVQGTF